MNELFWCVDCQKDFILPNGKLYIKGAETILPNLAKITSLAVKNSISVVSTGDYHDIKDEEISDKPDLIDTFPPHCLFNEEGSDFVDEAYPKLIHRHYFLVTPSHIGELFKSALDRSKDIIIYKNKFDVFKGNSYTDEILEILKPKDIYVYGVALDYCVKYAIEGLVERGYQVFLVTDATKGIVEKNLKDLLDKWEEEGIRMITTEELEKKFNENRN